MSWQNRPVAVVTGASRGLGFLLARALGRRGYRLVVCARSADGLEAAVADLRAEGVSVLPIAADVAVRSEAEELVARTARELGSLDVLVTNAGVIQVGPLASMSAEDFAAAHEVMYWGTVYPVLAALAVMREQGGGRILTITSLGGKLPAPHLGPYNAAKHAAVGFSESLRVEAGKHGVSVTTAVPGLMRTGSPRNATFKGDRTGEHTWFTIGAGLPLVSKRADAAAETIVRGALRSRPEVIVTPAAKLAVRLHGLAPSTTVRALSVADRLLPRGESPHAAPGHAVARTAGWFRTLTTLDRHAAGRWHQHDDQAR